MKAQTFYLTAEETRNLGEYYGYERLTIERDGEVYATPQTAIYTKRATGRIYVGKVEDINTAWALIVQGANYAEYGSSVY